MTVAVLEHNGFAVDVPKQDCCGLPLQSNGLFDDARAYVRRLVGRLAPVAQDDTVIVGTSTSCTLMLKREANEILGMEDEPDLEHVAARTYDIYEFLLELHDARGAADRLRPRRPRRSPTTRRASSRATRSASRRSTCSPSCPA